MNDVMHTCDILLGAHQQCPWENLNEETGKIGKKDLVLVCFDLAHVWYSKMNKSVRMVFIHLNMCKNKVLKKKEN